MIITKNVLSFAVSISFMSISSGVAAQPIPHLEAQLETSSCLEVPFRLAAPRVINTGEHFTDIIGHANALNGTSIPIDLNRNGLPDLIATNGTDIIALLDFNGRNFTVGPRLTLNAIRQLRAGEFDGQPGTDLAVLDGQTIRILKNSGVGSFSQVAFFYTAGIDVAGITAGDFNNDGRLDLAWAATTSYYGMIKNNGASFTSNPASTSFANFLSIETVNKNNDANPDIAIAAVPDGFFNLDSVKIGRYVSSNGGSFSLTGLRLPNDGLSSGMAMTKVNSDQYHDLAVLDDGAKAVRIFYGAASGFPANGNGSYSSGLGTAAPRLLTADLNKDNAADLITANSAGQVSILSGKGDGTFSAAALVGAQNTTALIAVADVEADSDLDILLPHATSGIVLLKNLIHRCE